MEKLENPASNCADWLPYVAVGRIREHKRKAVGASRSLIRDWTPGMDLTDCVLSASIEAFKPSPGEPASKVRRR